MGSKNYCILFIGFSYYIDTRLLGENSWFSEKLILFIFVFLISKKNLELCNHKDSLRLTTKDRELQDHLESIRIFNQQLKIINLLLHRLE